MGLHKINEPTRKQLLHKKVFHMWSAINTGLSSTEELFVCKDISLMFKFNTSGLHIRVPIVVTKYAFM
jgi:hypothetical protein